LRYEKFMNMNRKFVSIFSVLIIVVFIAYIVFDTSRPAVIEKKVTSPSKSDSLPDRWKISGELPFREGSLKAVTVASSGNIFTGGDSFVSCYSKDLRLLWSLKTPYPVTALSNCGDTVFASTVELILVIGTDGRLKDEWGPFEDKSFITSVASNNSLVAYADAGNKMVVVLDKQGIVKKIIGQGDGQFILPSPYFDVALDANNTLYVANTGHRRIETRTTEGRLISAFGEPGMAPGAFCGCCNPAHFIVTPDGFITSEKGINRIKVLGTEGEFVEFVSSANRFVPSVPLDLASADGNTVYAANPADSKLYIFTRK
jgi:DNA-binding beta-propeller fold protein YncE